MANELVTRLSLAPTTFDQAVKFAELAAASDLVPEAYRKKPANILLAIQHGYEVGLAPLQAIQSIAVVNGRPSLWGDAVLGLVRTSGKLERIEETDDGKVATCRVQRSGDPVEVVRTFSQEDAERAGLAKKSGPWTQYPARMRQLRARAFALRDAFPDVLRGLSVREEVEEYVETTATASTEPVKQPRRKSAAAVETATPAPEPAAPIATPEPTTETFIGLVSAIEPRTAANGSTYAAVTLEGHEDENVGTFSKSAMDVLENAHELGIAVSVAVERTAKGGWKILTAELLSEPDAVEPIDATAAVPA